MGLLGDSWGMALRKFGPSPSSRPAASVGGPRTWMTWARPRRRSSGRSRGKAPSPSGSSAWSQPGGRRTVSATTLRFPSSPVPATSRSTTCQSGRTRVSYTGASSSSIAAVTARLPTSSASISSCARATPASQVPAKPVATRVPATMARSACGTSCRLIRVEVIGWNLAGAETEFPRSVPIRRPPTSQLAPTSSWYHHLRRLLFVILSSATSTASAR